MLGTGTPNPEPDRAGPAVAIVTEGYAYLVDAGTGLVRGAAATGLPALEAARLNIAFLTHLHSDHTLGLPDLILTPWVLEREAPLRLFGPPGTAAMAAHLTAAYEHDIENRLGGLQPATPEGHRVHVTEIADGGEVFRDARVTVSAFRVRHAQWEHALGYRFDTADRSIVISGDAVPDESVVEACAGCDVLVHEVYAQSGFDNREPEWQRYHAAAHTSSHELAELATRARPGVLVLYHQLLWGATPEELVAEVRAGYTGRVEYASDLDIF